MERPLEGKVVLVTGAGVRLGKAIALGLGQAGASVAAHYHASKDPAEQTAGEIRREGGGQAQAFGADLADPRAAEGLVEEVERSLGPLAAVVNSAAVFHRAPFVDTPLELLESQWAINARGPYLLTQAAVRRMKARGQGDVVNIVDIGGALNPWPGYSAYGMTKAALASLTEALALELAPEIRVNAVAPGTVLPPEGLDERTLERLRERIPQRRFGSPEDIVRTVLFLLTGPRFITGQIIAVDGGRSLGTGLL